jgi:tetratricopeptide (TPR) repeat protein
MVRYLVTFFVLLTVPVLGADIESSFKNAQAHLQKGRYEEARDAYTKIGEEPDLAAADKTRIALAISRIHEEQGLLEDAMAGVRAGLEANPDAAKLWARLGQLQLLVGQYTEARESVEQALKLTSQQPLARLVRAQIDVETGRIDEALEGFRWFVQLYKKSQPDEPELLLLVGEGSFQYAEWKSVTSIFKFLVNTLCPDVLKMDGQRWEASVLSGRLLLQKYNRGQAGGEFDLALKVNPNCAAAHLGKAQVELQDHKLELADEEADKALKLNPNLVEALAVKSDIRIVSENPLAAREFIDKALKVNPFDQRTLARQAACDLLEDGLPPAAEWKEILSAAESIQKLDGQPDCRFLKLWKDLLGRNPKPGYFLSILGEALEAQRKFEHAERCYEAAITVMPQLAAPRTQLGMLYLRTGRTEEAESILNAAFKADPFHVRVSNMRKVIGVLKEYETISTDHFVIRIDKSQRVLGLLMSEYLEQVYVELVKEFGFEPEQRTQFEIYADAKGQPAHAWFSARMIGLPWIQTIGASTGRIVALASPINVESPFNWAKVLKHEFVHVLTLQGTQFNIPHWYTEALAVRSEGTLLRDDWIPILEERYPDELFTLDTVNSGFQRPKGRTDWDMAYCQSRLYADYLEKTYGADAPSRLLDAYRRQLKTDAALREVFHVEEADFENGFRKYVGEMLTAAKVGRASSLPPFEETKKAYEADEHDLRKKEAYSYRLMRTKKGKADQLLARDLAEEVLAKDKKSPWAAIVEARSLIREKHFPEAEEVLEAALDSASPNSEVLLVLSLLKAEDKEYEKLVELLTLAHEKFPREIRFTEGLADVLGKLKRDAEQKPLLELIAANDYDHVASRKKLAKVAWDAKDAATAARWAREALQIDVEDATMHAILARSLAALGQHADAARAWERLLLVDADSIEAPLGLAKALQGEGKAKEAIAQLDALLMKQPNNEEARRMRDDLKKMP